MGLKICIDAGHYKGYNPGVVKGYYEGDVVWKLANLVKQYLGEYKDVTVVMTRSDITKDLALVTRGEKSKGCDLFLSFHSNATTSESVDRAVVIYPIDNRNNSKVLAEKLASVINKTIGAKQNYQLMQRKSTSGTTEYYGVLRGARNVGCPRFYILEHGFHTNKATCNWLLKESNLEKLAKAEVEVLADYYGLKKKTATTTSTPTTSTNYIVKVTCDVLRVRKEADTTSAIVTTIKKGESYTIVSEKKGNNGHTWGKLKSGAGWIDLYYTEKLK